MSIRHFFKNINPTDPKRLNGRVCLTSRCINVSLFLSQLIDDKKALSERCEAVVGELKLVDQKYTKKIAQMQEQHDMVSSVHSYFEMLV